MKASLAALFLAVLLAAPAGVRAEDAAPEQESARAEVAGQGQDGTRAESAGGMLAPGTVEYVDGRTELLHPSQLPFGEEEVMDFELLYGFVRVGRARLETETLVVDGERRVLGIRSRARSERWVDSVYKVRDEIRSQLDIERMHSLRFEKELREGNYEHNLRADYLHEEGIARYDDGKVVDLVPGSQDILTALFYIRTFPLEEGMTLHVPVHDGKKSYALRVEVTGREIVETGLGSFSCLVLEPRMQSQGLFKSEGRMLIYLSDDDRRLPIKLKAKAPVGAFESKLSAYEPGRPLTGVSWATP